MANEARSIEQRLTLLEQRDERREAEHEKVLLNHEDLLKERKKLRDEFEEESNLLKAAFDSRLAEVAEGLTNGAAAGAWQPIVDLVVKAAECQAQISLDLFKRGLAHQETYNEHQHQFNLQTLDRLNKLEAIVSGRRAA
jgi:hypothetical protein